MNCFEREIFNRALNTWGGDAQIMVAIEELGEAISALARLGRENHKLDSGALNRAIIGELADASIVIDQMKVFFGEEAVIAERYRKITRLEELIDDANRKNSGALNE